MAQAGLRVLATGASGLIGRRLLRLGKSRLELNVVHGFSSIPLSDMQSVLRQAEIINTKIILHLAWPGSSHHGDYKTTEDNLIAKEKTIALAKLCGQAGVKLIVAGSGADNRPIPGNLYVSSKHETREALGAEIRDGRVVWLRPFNVFDGSSWPNYLKNLKSDKVVHITDNRPRDFIHVDDVCHGIISIISAGIAGYVDLGSGTVRTPSMLISASGGIAQVLETSGSIEVPTLPKANPPLELSNIWEPQNTNKFFRGENGF